MMPAPVADEGDKTLAGGRPRYAAVEVLLQAGVGHNGPARVLDPHGRHAGSGMQRTILTLRAL